MPSTSSSYIEALGELGGPLDLSKKLIENTQPAHQNSRESHTNSHNLNHNHNQLLLNFQSQLEQHFLHHQASLNMTHRNQITTPKRIRKSKKTRKAKAQSEPNTITSIEPTNSPTDHNNNNNNNNNDNFNYDSMNASDSQVSSQNILKAHLCLDCGRSFARSDMLTRHSRLHSGLKPYKCKRCNQIFSRSDHLSTHERTHTGEKPYQCEQCAYSACRRDMITRHMRTHENSINKSSSDHKKTSCRRVKARKSTISKKQQANNIIIDVNCHEVCSEPDQSTKETIDLNGHSPMTTTPRSESMSSSSHEFEEAEEQEVQLELKNNVIISDTTTTTTTTQTPTASLNHPLDLSKYNAPEGKSRVAVVNYQISSTS